VFEQMLSKNTHTSKHVVCDFVYIIDVGTEDPVAGPKQCGSKSKVLHSDFNLTISLRVNCQGATPTSDKARRPTPTTGDRGRRWRLIGKEGPASKVLSGTYENVAEVGTGRVAYLYTSIALCSVSLSGCYADQ